MSGSVSQSRMARNLILFVFCVATLVTGANACYTVPLSDLALGTFEDSPGNIVNGLLITLADAAFTAGCADITFPAPGTAAAETLNGARYDLSIVLSNFNAGVNIPAPFYVPPNPSTFIYGPPSYSYPYIETPNLNVIPVTTPQLFCAEPQVHGTCSFWPGGWCCDGQLQDCTWTPQTSGPDTDCNQPTQYTAQCCYDPPDEGKHCCDPWCWVTDGGGDNKNPLCGNGNDNCVASCTAFCTSTNSNAYQAFTQYVSCAGSASIQMYVVDIGLSMPQVSFSYTINGWNSQTESNYLYGVTPASTGWSPNTFQVTLYQGGSGGFTRGTATFAGFPNTLCDMPQITTLGAMASTKQVFFLGWPDSTAVPTTPVSTGATSALGFMNVGYTHTIVGGALVSKTVNFYWNTPLFDTLAMSLFVSNYATWGCQSGIGCGGEDVWALPYGSNAFNAAYGQGCTWNDRLTYNTPLSCAMGTVLPFQSNPTDGGLFTYVLLGLENQINLNPICNSKPLVGIQMQLGQSIWAHTVCNAANITAFDTTQPSLNSNPNTNIAVTICANSANPAGSSFNLNVVCLNSAVYPALTVSPFTFLDAAECTTLYITASRLLGKTLSVDENCTLYVNNCENQNIVNEQFTFEATVAPTTATTRAFLPSIVQIGSSSVIIVEYCQTAPENTITIVNAVAQCTSNVILPANGTLTSSQVYLSGNACTNLTLPYSVPSNTEQQNITCAITAFDNLNVGSHPVSSTRDAIMIIGCSTPIFIFGMQNQAGYPTTTINETSTQYFSNAVIGILTTGSAFSQFSTVLVSIWRYYRNGTQHVYEAEGAPVLAQISSSGSYIETVVWAEKAGFNTSQDSVCVRATPIAPCTNAGFFATSCATPSSIAPYIPAASAAATLGAVVGVIAFGLVAGVIGLVFGTSSKAREGCKRCCSRSAIKARAAPKGQYVKVPEGDDDAIGVPGIQEEYVDLLGSEQAVESEAVVPASGRFGQRIRQR